MNYTLHHATTAAMIAQVSYWRFSEKVKNMGRSYFTEDAKMFNAPVTRWTAEECYAMQNILDKKGYFVTCVSRVGADRKYHDAWLLWREDIGRLVEQLFRHRLVVEVQAEGRGKASINFVYDTTASEILSFLPKIWRNKKGDVL